MVASPSVALARPSVVLVRSASTLLICAPTTTAVPGGTAKGVVKHGQSNACQQDLLVIMRRTRDGPTPGLVAVEPMRKADGADQQRMSARFVRGLFKASVDRERERERESRRSSRLRTCMLAAAASSDGDEIASSMMPVTAGAMYRSVSFRHAFTSAATHRRPATRVRSFVLCVISQSIWNNAFEMPIKPVSILSARQY